MTPLEDRKPVRRIIVCGGRTYSDTGRIASVLEEYLPAVVNLPAPTIVHGDARGADRLAAREAAEMGFPVEAHPAEWDSLPAAKRKAAGVIRNQRMLDLGADLVVAFAGGTGTADMVRRARKAGVPVREEP